LRSEEGEGAEFTLCLPLAFDRRRLSSQQQVELTEVTDELFGEQALMRIPREPVVAPSGESAPFSGHRVLLVDDELRNLLALTPQLEAWGLQVVAAGDAQEALETLKEDSAFSLVLMDLGMPERDGYDTIREVREKMHLTALIIVAMGSGDRADEHGRCLDAGADDCLSDRSDFPALKRIIQRHLGL
ncbi:MAG: response regulator, partial [Candidatus Thiodiazotropha sp.]